MNETDQSNDELSSDKTQSDQTITKDGGRMRIHEKRILLFGRSLHPGLIAALMLAVVVFFFLGWYLIGSGGNGGGQPVPAPRTSVGEMPAETKTNQILTLTPDQLQNAGISVETVGEQLSSESTETSATGTVEANEYRQTPAVSLLGGVVRRVGPVLGENVRAGQTVAVIFSDEFAQTQSRYIALRTEAENARRNYERTQRLVTINQPGKSELEQAVKQRKAAEASVNEMRNRYLRTSRLLEIGASSREEFEQDNTKLRTAEAELDEARLREERATMLLPISPEVRGANEEALNKLRSAETELAASRQKLILYGLPPSRVASLRSPSEVRAELAVPAPVSGTVTARSVNAGEVIEANKELFRITDLSSVWVIAQVYERDLGRLREGIGASVTSDAFPNQIFRGHVTYIDPQIDETTRTGKVRVEIANPNRRLRIGMYVRTAIGAVGGAERTVPIVPGAAVQNMQNQQIVFVQTADPNVFELRFVKLGFEANGNFQVIEGLKVGDRVVTNGSFALRAEWLKSNQGTEHNH